MAIVHTVHTVHTLFSEPWTRKMCEQDTYLSYCLDFCPPYLSGWSTQSTRPQVTPPQLTIPLLTHKDVYLVQVICYTRIKNEAVMTIRRALKYFVYANLVAWLLTFSFAGLLAWALMELDTCGTGNIEIEVCMLPYIYWLNDLIGAPQTSHTLATVFILAWWGEIVSVEGNVFMGGIKCDSLVN